MSIRAEEMFPKQPVMLPVKCEQCVRILDLDEWQPSTHLLWPLLRPDIFGGECIGPQSKTVAPTMTSIFSCMHRVPYQVRACSS